MIPIYLKNMAGELIHLTVEPSASLLEIAQQASALDPEQFPPGRTKVMRMDEEQELSEDEVLVVLILEAYLESGVFPLGGEPYHRWVIPFRDQTMYLYVSHRWGVAEGAHFASYAISFTPEMTTPSEGVLVKGGYLYHMVRTILPDVTPQEMKILYDCVMPYWSELGRENGYEIVNRWIPQEPVLCGCGSIVKRSGLNTHLTTKKHRSWSQKGL